MAKHVGLRQDGGQNARVKSFKQPAGAYSPYDPQAPRVKPGASTVARKAAVAVEDAIRGDALETGVFIGADGIERLRRTGKPDRVGFTVLELSTKAGTTFTHNHPDNGSFSPADYRIALSAGVAELRAVTPQFRHILVMGGQDAQPCRAGANARLVQGSHVPAHGRNGQARRVAPGADRSRVKPPALDGVG